MKGSLFMLRGVRARRTEAVADEGDGDGDGAPPGDGLLSAAIVFV